MLEITSARNHESHRPIQLVLTKATPFDQGLCPIIIVDSIVIIGHPFMDKHNENWLWK